MADEELLSDYLNREIVADSIITLTKSRKAIDRQMGTYLHSISVFYAFPPPPPAPPVAILGSVVKKARRGKPQAKKRGDRPISLHTPRTPVQWGRDFILEMLGELRRIICGKGKTPPKLGKGSQSAITALAAAVTHSLGVTNPTALGIAILIFLSLGNAGKNAFCRMTTAEVLESLIHPS